MTEEHVLDQLLGQCAAVQADEGPSRSRRGLVQHAGQNFFAGAGGTHQQGADLGLSHLLRQGQQLLAGRVDEHHAARPNRSGQGLLGCTHRFPGFSTPILGGQHMIGAQPGGLSGEVHTMRRHAAHHGQAAPGHLRQRQAFLQHFDVVFHPDHQDLHMHERGDELTRVQEMTRVKTQADHAGLLGSVGRAGGVDPGDSNGGCARIHGGVGLTFDNHRQATAMPARQTLAEIWQVLVS